MRLVAISLVVGVIVVISCSRKPNPERVREQRKEQAHTLCENLANDFQASYTWAESMKAKASFSAFDAGIYTIDVQDALLKPQRIVAVGTVHDVLQQNGAYRVCLSCGDDSWWGQWSFESLPVMFVLTCSDEDADRMRGIRPGFGEPALVFVAEVTAVEKAMFRVTASNPEDAESFAVEVEPGRTFLAYGRCLTFKELD